MKFSTLLLLASLVLFVFGGVNFGVSEGKDTCPSVVTRLTSPCSLSVRVYPSFPPYFVLASLIMLSFAVWFRFEEVNYPAITDGVSDFKGELARFLYDALKPKLYAYDRYNDMYLRIPT